MLAQTWNYAAPNLDGTCPNPDTQMLIRNTAPGTCILNYHPPIFTRKCMQPDPYTHGRNIGFQKQSNKDHNDNSFAKKKSAVKSELNKINNHNIDVNA